MSAVFGFLPTIAQPIISGWQLQSNWKTPDLSKDDDFVMPVSIEPKLFSYKELPEKIVWFTVSQLVKAIVEPSGKTVT